jgi:hypothetical protein
VGIQDSHGHWHEVDPLLLMTSGPIAWWAQELDRVLPKLGRNPEVVLVQVLLDLTSYSRSTVGRPDWEWACQKLRKTFPEHRQWINIEWARDRVKSFRRPLGVLKRKRIIQDPKPFFKPDLIPVEIESSFSGILEKMQILSYTDPSTFHRIASNSGPNKNDTTKEGS